MLKTKKIQMFTIINAFIIFSICFVTLYPFLYILSVSLSNPIEILHGNVVFFPKGFNLEYYKWLLFPEGTRTNLILLGYKNSFIYVVLGGVISMILTILGAYPLSRPEFKGRIFFSFYIAFTMLFHGGLVPTYLVVSGLGLIDSIWSMVLPSAISAFNLIVLRTFFQSLPSSLIEAAKIDGCGHGKILTAIVLPCSVSGLMMVMLFYMVVQWNAYMPGLLFLIQSEEKLPMQNILRKIINMTQNSGSSESGSGRGIQEGIRYAATALTALPIIMVYPFIQKYFAKGLMIGGVKG